MKRIVIALLVGLALATGCGPRQSVTSNSIVLIVP